MPPSTIPISKQLSLTTLTPADQPGIWELMHRIYPPAYHNFWPDGGRWYVGSLYNPAHFAGELSVADTLYCSIRWEGDVVGIVRVVDHQPLPEQPERRASKLHRLYLDQRVHGRGIGRTVIEWVIATRRARGQELLWLDTMEQAPAARAFYQQLGFTESAYVQLDMPLLYPSMRGMYRVALPLHDAQM
ncbi:hypothetical protein LEM8419_00367 [Neolewinella maritima]|uniref:N-acetyltransferase domain-containing protein n=1 Tax=Neolewinella maritima TaxID=1383882 RepID=A0ABM9AWN8_9BACT|nr:GNAT family N-acetyltransferase [Neolewinella maritima]CAH0999072.1 hypothetical protein LEM8419_00367 [Neolewinella maritima]